EDEAQKPEIAVQLAEKMIQSDKVDLLTGIIWSNLAMAVVPNAVAQDVIYLSPNAGPSALAGAKCNKNYFNVAYQNDNFHEAMGQYANKDYKKTFILAPNYPAGKDSLTGFKRYYKGELAGEAYTQIGQADYAAEIAQIRDSGADSVFFFLPGGMGISFMKQYAQSGVNIPVMGPGFSFDQDILPAVGDAALGVKNSASWSRDLDNEANKQFVEAFKAEYNRLPSIYAAQSWDTANLILSALSKASVKDKDAFRAALKAADFKSVRGEFTFNTNNHPVQNIYVREVVKEGDVLTNKIIATAFEHHKDAYADQCKM
ncbi:ABC transporter substrate-binding protein, partial [Mesorhizobium sp. M7A.F.Ca.MR.228.00.0.0]